MRRVFLALTFAALPVLALAAAQLSPPALQPAPLCRVEAAAVPDDTPGLYTVTVQTTTTLTGQPCPPDGYALIRLESGRQYPLSAVVPGVPFVRSGIPWYWRVMWRALSGKVYRVPIRGMVSPFLLDGGP
ncbi:hypothetical protein MF271_19275 (plasmid) [Deinococcus sp. KNUC1210]|uniref:hypothetical protein n=1 Tax=Deinococcus sp. KNUC1210 TaxID=2917691 RepID=UPI001EF00ED5|nr:hypothetical protein [Deinococcus sp. KNUC1210]ULH17333.1 hypothetical protein MF271_19275 [Deinococcus sp. KNUC1210]